ncbi:periphilin-1 isoform X2 [Willisornis vidua]|uniref:Periphilin-1 isoform X2 n=1 Tax=Willisornis vidua TaxID=1566151 RepID=A0ABQ9CK21_9PASS|nr:periphilin-1 isoform X2 [Willisornis vidua]
MKIDDSMAYRRDEMWSEGRYDYERVPRERLPPRIHGDSDYHRIANVGPKKPPLLERPGDGNYSRYDGYSHAEYRDYEEGRSFAHDRRSGPPHRGVRKERTLRTSRDASPSGSTPVPSSKALEKSNRLSEKELAEAASKWAAEKAEKAEESNLPEITDYDKTNQTFIVNFPCLSGVTNITYTNFFSVDGQAGSSAPLYIEQTEETEANITDTAELYEDGQLLGRSKAIAAKTKEIEQVYRQDCETFGMVVKMLIDKDPSLEKSIQFALRQNLHEIGERCIEELKHFIAQYDAANQDLSESFKEGSY